MRFYRYDGKSSSFGFFRGFLCDIWKVDGSFVIRNGWSCDLLGRMCTYMESVGGRVREYVCVCESIRGECVSERVCECVCMCVLCCGILGR